MPHPITIRNVVAERLRQLRESYGQQIGQRLNQSDFSILLGLRAKSYGSYERSDREPSLEALVALRRVTGVSLDELIGDCNATEQDRSRTLPHGGSPIDYR